MNNSSKLLEYKEQIEQAMREKEQAVGAIKNLKEQLKSKFDCATLEEAEEKLSDLKKQVESIEQDIEDMINTFEKKYADVIDMV